MAARSQRLGQFQSKSHSGLKRPIWAACSRRSRLRRARSCSSQSSNGCDPACGGDLRPVRQQAVQMQRLGAGAQGVGVSHRNAP